MKRFFCVLLCLPLLSACQIQVQFAVSTTKPPTETTGIQENTDIETQPEIRAAWLSYLELNPQKLTQKSAYCAYLKTLFAPLEDYGITELFVQVRPFADAIYPSALFPSSHTVVAHRGDALPFDFLQVILDVARPLGLHIHAWINPYRVGNAEDFAHTKNSESRLAALSDANALLQWQGNVYLDPSSEDVRALILDGVRELLENYNLAGIHIDDYFYPTADAAFDKTSFIRAKSSDAAATLSKWRKKQINLLLRSLYQTVKSFGSEKIFSVSPAGDIKKNETVYAADVRKWAGESGYCDWLLPQIYYGFQHSSQPFERCLKQWKKICTAPSVRLIAGLALYKIGTTDAYAGEGIDEWNSDAGVLAKQVQCLRAQDCDGFALYSVKFLQNQKKLFRKALTNLQDVL